MPLPRASLAHCMLPLIMVESVALQVDGHWLPPGAMVVGTEAKQPKQVSAHGSQAQMMEALLGLYFLFGGGYYAVLGVLRWLVTS